MRACLLRPFSALRSGQWTRGGGKWACAFALVLCIASPCRGQDDLIEQADAALTNGDYNKAITKYDELIRRYPKLAPAYLNRGLAYQRKGDYDKAIANYNEVIRLEPEYANAYHNRGNAFQLKGDLTAALADYDKAIQLDPRVANAYGDRGNLYREKGKLSEAIRDYDEAIRLDAQNPNAYYARAYAYREKGDYDKAITDLDKAIQLNPTLGPAHYLRALIYEAKGEYEKAIAGYKQVIQLDAKYANAYNGLAWLLSTSPDDRVRDGKKAVEYANKACTLSEWKDPNMVDTLAAACAESGDYQQAIKWATQYLATPNLIEKEIPGARSRLALYQAHKPYHRDK
jgi:tetratricopeptide (TPR) repeat protein